MAVVRLKRDGSVAQQTHGAMYHSCATHSMVSSLPNITSGSIWSWRAPGLGHSSGISCGCQKPRWCESGWEPVGRRCLLLITSTQRSPVSLGTALKSWEASPPMAFVDSSLYYPLTDTSTKLPLIIEHRESSEIFRFLWLWENKECVLSCRTALSKLWPSQNCSNYTIVIYTVNTWKPRQANICYGVYLLHKPLIFPQEITM